MSTRLTAQAPSSRRREDVIGVLVTAVFTTAGMAVVLPAMPVPAHVDRIIIDNPHPWTATVDITNADRDGWIDLGTVERETEQVFREVMDQGDEWIVRFSYSGTHVDVGVTGRELDRGDWRITVPDEFADRLRSADVPETPP